MDLKTVLRQLCGGLDSMSEAELKVTLVMLESTLLSGSTECRYTYEQLRARTGLAQATIAAGLRRVATGPYFERTARSRFRLRNSSVFEQYAGERVQNLNSTARTAAEDSSEFEQNGGAKGGTVQFLNSSAGKNSSVAEQNGAEGVRTVQNLNQNNSVSELCGTLNNIYTDRNGSHSKKRDDNLETAWGMLRALCQGDLEAGKVWQLQERFSAQMGIKRPSIDSQAGREQLQRDWWPHLRDILRQADGDLEMAAQAMAVAQKEMDGARRPLVIASPKSIVRTTVGAIGRAKRSGRQEGGDPAQDTGTVQTKRPSARDVVAARRQQLLGNGG